MSMTTEEEVLAMVRAVVQAEGSQNKAARRLDISSTLLGKILKGEAPVGEKIARKLGFNKRVVYVKAKE